MKRNTLKQLAIFGIASGLLVQAKGNANDSWCDKCGRGHLEFLAKQGCTRPSGCSELIAEKDKGKSDIEDPNKGNLGYHLFTEKELLLELNDETTKLYNELSPEGKALALQVASQRCNYSNTCKGLNACQTDENACAGQGSCKGKSKCAISDKNLAVKLVSKKMAAKRSGL